MHALLLFGAKAADALHAADYFPAVDTARPACRRQVLRGLARRGHHPVYNDYRHAPPPRTHRRSLPSGACPDAATTRSARRRQISPDLAQRGTPVVEQ